MPRQVVFISFDYDNDRHFKNMLLAWDKNKNFEFELFNGSLKAAVNSTESSYIKSKIKPLIEKSSTLLCIVGKEGGTNEWIDWEVRTAAALRKRLIGVKVDRSYASPPSLLNNGASWAMSFTFDAISKALA